MMEFDAFISYSNQDKTAADAACAFLEGAGVRCWIAPRDIMAGGEYGAAIVDAIDHCRVMVLIFSASANNSGQIRREIERAVSKSVPIVPLRIEQVIPTKSMEYFLGAIHWLDALTPPLETHLQKLADTVKALVEVPNARTAPDASPPPAARDKPAYAAQRQFVEPKPGEAELLKIQIPRRLAASIGAAACLVLALGGLWMYRARAPVPPSVPAASTPQPVHPVAASIAQPPQKPVVALVPETIPFVRNADRDAIRSEYLTAPDHKALAISYSRIGFTSGQADDATAEAAAMDSCKRAMDAIKSSNPCWPYAVGNTLVFSGGTPPMPPTPWLIRNSAIETAYAPDNLPLVNDNVKTHFAKNYADVTQAKVLSLSPRGHLFDYWGGSEEENIRRALEACGHMAGVACKIVAVDNTFVIPIPTTLKVVGFFNVNTDPMIAPEMRSALVERFASATNAWNAVAVGASGIPGTALNAANEKDAIEKALTDCGRHDRECRVIALGPFTVVPAATGNAPQSPAASVPRGWIGVRIQSVTDDLAEKLNIKPPRGAFVAGVDDKGPAKPAGIEPGDVVVSFDGHDIKEMLDLPRMVTGTTVGKQVQIVLIRGGKEETHTIRVGRLEETPAPPQPTTGNAPHTAP